MMDDKIIIEGVMRVSNTDTSFYTEDHDIPVTCIGRLSIVGDGYENCGWNTEKNENHIRWKLEEGKKYRVTIEEIDDE